MKLKLYQIKPNTWNCNFLGEQERKNLKHRMTQDGPQKTLPIVIRKIQTTTNNDNNVDVEVDVDGYEIVDGEHRWAIAKELGWTEIEVVVQEANDLESKSLCISYNRLRGRLNWFKLYDVVCKDLADGVNLSEAYKEALTGEELKWLLSLGSLAPEARLILEDSLKKYPELSLEQLYLITLFPEWQQKSLIEKFKNSVIAHALIKALTPFLPQPPNQQQQQKHQHQQQQTPYCMPDQTNYLTQQTDKPNFPNKASYENNNALNTHTVESPTTAIRLQNEFKPDLWTNSQKISLEGIDKEKQTPPTFVCEKETVLDAGEEVVRALLIAVNYHCDCGRFYHTNFKSMRIVVQKKDMLFEHVDFEPRTFIVHCSKCNNDSEFTIDNSINSVENKEVVQILCNRCKPSRKGLLNTNTGEAKWFNNNNNNIYDNNDGADDDDGC